MKVLLLLLSTCLVAAMAPRDAHAYASCYSNQGFAPGKGVVLPPHPRIVYFTDAPAEYVDLSRITATIDGKKVPVKVTVTKAAPYHLAVIEIDSDRTGALIVKTQRFGPGMRYKIAKQATMPEEVPVTIGRFVHLIRHSTVQENFDGLALRLPAGTPAITAHVKLRRDHHARWAEFDVPVAPHDFDDPRPMIRMGELGCTRNYSVPLLESGVDLEVTITLTDGTTRPAKDLAAHVELPETT